MRKIVAVPAALTLLGALGGGALAAPSAAPPEGPPAGPPPAWVDTKSGDQWLAFSSYCWTPEQPSDPVAACATFIPPDQRPEVPAIALKRREVVKFNFGFTPSEVTLQVGKRSYRLAARATTAWRVQGKGGIAVLSVEAPAGSASYVARVRVTKAAKQRAAARASRGGIR